MKWHNDETAKGKKFYLTEHQVEKWQVDKMTSCQKQQVDKTPTWQSDKLTS